MKLPPITEQEHYFAISKRLDAFATEKAGASPSSPGAVLRWPSRRHGLGLLGLATAFAHGRLADEHG